MTHLNLKFYGHKEFLSFRATINFCRAFFIDFFVYTLLYIIDIERV